MNNIFKLLLLGLMQGFSEFLPISSSAHLVITEHFLGLKDNLVFLDVCLHMGTLFSIFVFFFKDIIAFLFDKKMAAKIAIVTAITGSIALVFMKALHSCFDNPALVAIILVCNGFLILSTKFVKTGVRLPGYLDSMLMGISQGLAVTPGISRSGATISTLLFRKIDLQEAFRFSFLASIPAILAAFVYEAKDIDWSKIRDYNLFELGAGMFIAFLSGLLALKVLRRSLKNNKFHYFGYYCIAAGAVFFFLLK